jgi:hypothetical protein
MRVSSVRQTALAPIIFCTQGRAGALFFNLRLTRRTNTELEVGGRQRDAVAFGFTQKMRKDGDRGFALDDALREIKAAFS